MNGFALATPVDAFQDRLPNGFTRSQIASAITPRLQELILLPTEKCNFRCTYCYEDFELGKMSAVTQRSIERFISRRVSEIKYLRFSWFGGEPLVAKDVVLRLSRFARDICHEHGIRFEGGLTTNAYLLTPALAKELLDCNQNFFQITFDGYGEAHDRVRQRADGKGTFDVIWANLRALREIDRPFECSVRVHVRRENLENLKTFVTEFARAFKGDSRFHMDFQHLRDMGGAGGQTITSPISLKELAVIETDMRRIYLGEVYRARGVEIPVDASPPVVVVRQEDAGESAGGQRASDSPSGSPYICYASRPNSLLIRSNGRIGKCTVALSDERNDIGKLAEDGTIEIDNAKLSPWFRGLGSLNTSDAGCPIKNMPAAAVTITNSKGEIRNHKVIALTQAA